MIRLSLIEDDAPTRDALVALFKGTPGFQLVSAHANAEDALAHLPLSNVDVVMVDIGLPGVSGIECVQQLLAGESTLNILMFTVHEDAETLFEALKAGANGYILKRTPPAEIIAAIEEVMEGGAPMTPSVARKVLQYFHGRKPGKNAVDDLTSREKEVLQELAIGCTYKEVAQTLKISLDTVRNHVQHIYKKLHVHSKTEAVLAYVRRQRPSRTPAPVSRHQAPSPRRKNH